MAMMIAANINKVRMIPRFAILCGISPMNFCDLGERRLISDFFLIFTYIVVLQFCFVMSQVQVGFLSKNNRVFVC